MAAASSQHFPAPLPSPTGQHPRVEYFASISQHAQQQQLQQQHVMYLEQQRQYQLQEQQRRQPPAQQQPQRQASFDPRGDTNNFLNQSTLLAEAAKRAQMQVLMRDLDEMDLS